ncbi:hypothetical protein Tola_0649 [Tolumonas auensis DSM 9187]|uniref:Uncharacterized protein n=1 Tax=Tolumonas auensis (strain DSM 9187 / NBRC 110442 / TA 4) TaxID=595494 RepID=C4LAS4_TOLAT|nr:hypothetical protein Tola_0649 [Tolumonas auensis DSM 9187]
MERKENVALDRVMALRLAHKFEPLHKADIPLSISIQNVRVCIDRFCDINHYFKNNRYISMC